MRIGVLELLRAEVSTPWNQKLYDHLIVKQYASIMPQAVSVWCRSLGHKVFYATYFGQRDPRQLLPSDLDVVFVSGHTEASALAYALAKLYRRENTVTVMGGPHAKQFPHDCLRFFDIAVRDCDRSLIVDILRELPRGEIVSSGHTLQEIPSVQERMPEIRAANFWRGRPYPLAVISLLTSTGCPYSCDFCVDWNNPYVLLPPEQLEADLRYIVHSFPEVLVSFHDPNFAIKFDEVLDVIEKLPRDGRRRYAMESSLSILRPSRLERLREVGFAFVAPGVESWTAYSNKAGTGPAVTGREKLERVVKHFALIHEYIPMIQANFIFGLDCDEGDEPVELMKEFATRAPFVWPNVGIPTPYGETPLYHQHLRDGRMLTSMPFAFYWGPYLVTTPRNYTPVAYYERISEIFSHSATGNMLIKRLQANSGLVRFAHSARTVGLRAMAKTLRGLGELMKSDTQFRAFHERETNTLPEFYHRQFERLLGPYAGLLSKEDRLPTHQPMGRA
ncbi:MAG: radical SAM protein [Anaerolineae bacterium]|nr:radical SAM protein [Anaerolineae bacterium]